MKHERGQDHFHDNYKLEINNPCFIIGCDKEAIAIIEQKNLASGLPVCENHINKLYET